MKLKILTILLFCFSVASCKVDREDFDLLQEDDSQIAQKKKDLTFAEKNFQDWLEKRAWQSKQDLTSYLSKYFPKVFSVRERFFSKMTPEDIANGLREIIDMISERPWLYLEQLFKQISKNLSSEEKKKWKDAGYDFDALPQKFDDKNVRKWLEAGGGFWEFIVDQFTFYNEFIECAKVDAETNVVFLKKNDFDWEFFSDFKIPKKRELDKSESLKDYWIKRGIQIHYEFYALCFDYWAKLFLEAILQKDLDLACRYQLDLKVIMNKLTGSSYESERQDDMKNYRELVEILKQLNKNEEKGYSSSFEELMDFWDN